MEKLPCAAIPKLSHCHVCLKLQIQSESPYQKRKIFPLQKSYSFQVCAGSSTFSLSESIHTKSEYIQQVARSLLGLCTCVHPCGCVLKVLWSVDVEDEWFFDLLNKFFCYKISRFQIMFEKNCPQMGRSVCLSASLNTRT